MSEKTHWRKLQNPEFIGSWDLEGDTDVLITDITTKEITGIKGTTRETVLILKGMKPMIVNVTNQLTIQQLYGAYIEDWIGKTVTLFPTTTKVRGEKMDCIRIRKRKPTQKQEKKKSPIDDARLEQAIDAIKSGAVTREKVESQFTLTAKQKNRLDEGLKD